jgi:hypothetical protein
MSGSGGYYKYRCKYWLTYNCPNWVWVNNAPCAHCLVRPWFRSLGNKADRYQADGRDSDAAMMSGPLRISREIYVPQFENGFLHYTIMEIIAASDTDSGWSVKDLPSQPLPSATGPSAVNFTAIDGLDIQKSSKTGFQAQGEESRWAGSNDNFE